MASFLTHISAFLLYLMDASYMEGFWVAVERSNVIRHVSHRVLNDSNSFIDAVLLVVRIGREELDTYLKKFRKI